MDKPKKSLGQHWLVDDGALESICAAAELQPSDVVLEIGPGKASLTKKLVTRAREVIAVEKDELLAVELPYRVPDDNLTAVCSDVLQFDLSGLPKNYKVVANIPYYLTSNLIRVLNESVNPPVMSVLLVQKEVAQRAAATPGDMSLLAIGAQFYNQVSLGPVVKADLFQPRPEVDSQVLILKRKPQAISPDVDQKLFFRIVRAGFSSRRKTLLNSLSGGLNKHKTEVDRILKSAEISPKIRPQELSLTDWYSIYLQFKRHSD